MRFVPFESGHMLWVRDVHENVLSEQRGIDLVKLGESCLKKGPCLTLMNDREAIACGGLVFLFPETAEIWLRLSMQGRGPHAVRELKAQMFRWIEEYHLDRVQATAQLGWQEDQGFLEWLGMNREGVMRKYGPGGLDQVRYAWVRE